MELKKFKDKIKKSFNDKIKENLINKFEEIKEDIINFIMFEYDSELAEVVTDRRSKTNPLLYREEFLDVLNEFEFVKELNNTVTLRVPDMNNFSFSGRLKVIESIMNGTAGTYIEVDGEQYERLFNKKPVNEEPIDKYVPKKERIYLIRRTAQFVRLWRNAFPDVQYVEFPFSNTPPIRIFESANEFVEKNMNDWIDDAVERAKKEFVKEIKA